MDFEWTNRPGIKPVWSSKDEDPSTPRKREFELLIGETPIELCAGPIGEVNSPQAVFGAPQSPMFGAVHNQNVPFIFQSPAPPQPPPTYPWTPPPNFSAEKAFQKEEPKDIDMSEMSPAKTECDQNEKENGRPMALGALRRVYNQRQKSRLTRSRLRQKSYDEDDASDFSNEENDGITPITQNTSNHYTLNMPAPAPPPSEAPYLLLGSVLSHMSPIRSGLIALPLVTCSSSSTSP